MSGPREDLSALTDDQVAVRAAAHRAQSKSLWEKRQIADAEWHMVQEQHCDAELQRRKAAA